MVTRWLHHHGFMSKSTICWWHPPRAVEHGGRPFTRNSLLHGFTVFTSGSPTASVSSLNASWKTTTKIWCGASWTGRGPRMLRDHGWTWGVSLVHKHGESLKQFGIWLPKVWIDTSQRWGCLKLVDLYDTHIMRNYPKKPGIITISVQFFSFQIGIPT